MDNKTFEFYSLGNYDHSTEKNPLKNFLNFYEKNGYELNQERFYNHDSWWIPPYHSPEIDDTNKVMSLSLLSSLSSNRYPEL